MRSSSILEPRRSVWSAALVGIGMMAAVDEIVFHQLLRWHHFFDLSTPAIGIISDGILHSAELIILVTGFFMLGDLIRHGNLAKTHAWAGFFLGAGGFQLFDGIIDHKVLRLHQIRYVDNLLLYDLLWNLGALLLILIGLWLYRRARAGTVT